MRNIVLIVHTSLDGYVAGIHGELDGFAKGEENLEFVCKLTENADAALFGRISYQLLDAYWPTAMNHPGATQGEIEYSRWYNAARKIVISRTLPGSKQANKTVIGRNIVDEIQKVRLESGKDILIFGSPSVSQLLMKHDLIDSYWIFVNPSIFGTGIPLFARQANPINLKLITTHPFANGEFVMNYVRESGIRD